MSEDDAIAKRQADAWRAMGYEWVEGGEGGGYQYTGIHLKPSVQPPTLTVAPGMTTERLQELTKQAPITKPRVVEGGEGSYTTYDYYDPASQAKKLLAQPEKVSAEYISRNFPSLAQLPKSVLNQMGQDWRTAYAHIQKMPEQSASGWWGGKGGAEGIVTVPFRLGPGDQPELAVGGNGEMFAEALPYVTYSPEYGLGIPKAGMRPYKEKFGIMNLAPAIMLGAALGPMAGAFGGGAAGTAAAGAITGGLGAIANDADILKGALTGGITAGLAPALSPQIDSALSAAGVTGSAASAVKSGAIAAGRAALTGQDPLQAALMAATGAGVGSAVSGTDLIKSLDPTVAKAVTAAASSAARAAVSGKDPVESALMGVANVGLQSAFGGAESLLSSLASGTQEGAPKDATQDILGELAQQERNQQEMQDVFDRLNPPDFTKDIMSALEAQQTERDKAIFALEQMTEQPASTMNQDVLSELARQESSQRGMEQALLNEIDGTSFDQRLKEVLAQQDESQAGMETELRGYDQRIVDLMQQGETEQAEMRLALDEILGDQKAQKEPAQQQTGSLSQLLTSTLAGLAGKPGAASQIAQQQAEQAQAPSQQAAQQADLSSLLAIMGLAQKGKTPPAPIPTVGEIKPYEFSSDLLTGIYRPPQTGLFGTNEQLLNLARGRA